MVQRQDSRGMHRGHYGHPGPADDHSLERCLGDVWSIPEPQGNTLKGSMMFKMVLVYSETLEKREERTGNVPCGSERCFGAMRYECGETEILFGVSDGIQDVMMSSGMVWR